MNHEFPADLLNFVTERQWTFAKTMPEWPHEYLLRSRVGARLFERLAVHIRTIGHEDHFYEKAVTYF